MDEWKPLLLAVAEWREHGADAVEVAVEHQDGPRVLLPRARPGTIDATNIRREGLGAR